MKLPVERLLLPLLIALGLGDPGARALPQEARSPFDVATVELDKDQSPFRRLVDFDLDGDLDALGFQTSANDNQRHYRLVSYENDGAGVFSEVWSMTGTAAGGVLDPHHLFLFETGFLDGDSYPDIGLIYHIDGFVFLGQGDGQFVGTTIFEVDLVGLGLELAELDGDGIDDWIWSGDWFDLDEYRTLHVIRSTGGTSELQHDVDQARSVHVLPQDGPGGEDVILLAGESEVQVFHATQGSNLTAGPYFLHGLASPMCDTGDVDGDGDIDAVLFQGEPASYRVLRRLDADSWTLETALTGGPAEFLADVDGDGDPDGVCCGSGGSTPLFEDNVQPSDFQISINDGSGIFAPTFRIPGLGSPQLAGAADVDGDLDVDLVAGRCVYFAIGPILPPDGVPVVPTWRGRRDLSDFDTDGDVDVSFSVGQVFTNDGGGSFATETPLLEPAPFPYAYRGPGFPGDFDGDGDVDLLVELRRPKIRQASRQGGELLGMAYLRNDGAGALEFAGLAGDAGLTFALDSVEAEASLLIDPDEDGDLDLVTRTMGSPAATSRWTNDGTGHFTLYAAWDGKRVEWDGDVDLDGDNDLLLSTPVIGNRWRLDLYLGVGDGVTFTYDSRPGLLLFDAVRGGLAVGDYVQDGYPDFAIARSVGVNHEGLDLYNDFALGGSLVQGLALESEYLQVAGARVSLGDVDGDGLHDALVGPHDEELVFVSEVHVKQTPLGVGPGSFDVAQQLVSPGLLVDLDGDGDEDLLCQDVVKNRMP